MPIVRTGAFFEDNQTFTYGFSDASGSLEISGGDGLTLSSSSGAGPYLSAGRSGSGVLDPAAVGTISLRDTGTVLEVISAGSATHGASLAIARGDDTRGLMQITDGAMFRLTDPTGPDNSDATDGGETGWIGRGARAEGALSLRAGEFIFSGTGSNLSVGREGGTGSVSMTDGSGFVMETTSAGEDDFTHLRIGINDGIGQFDMVESFALVQAGLNAGAAVDVGRFGGTGSLTIAGSSAPPFRDGLFLVGQAYSPLVELRVGLQDGTGNLNMTGGTLAVANSGVEVLRDGGSARWPGDGALGGGAALSVGREGGTGSLMAEESATLFIGGLEYTTALIGVGDRALGEVILDASSMRVVSFEGTGGLQIGEWQGGESTGRMTLRNEADSSVEGRESAYAIVGRWEGSDGMLVIQDGSSLSLNSESGSASLQVGLDEGEGRATLSGAGSSIELVALETYFRVGENGGTGHVTAGAGSTIALNALTSQAAVTIGAGGGAGSLVLDNASLSAQSLGYEAGLMVGEWHTGGATGTLELRNGATAVVQGAEGVFANVGRRAENEGFVSILSGSRLDLIGDDNTSANMRIGRNEGAGRLEINGADSLLRLAGDLTLGREGGAGTGEVENGGAIENQRTGFTATRIGQHEGSEGTLTLLGGSVMTRSLGMHDARIDVGVEGGEGRLTLDEGAVVTLHAGRYAAFSVGVAPGSDGSIAVAGQSTVSILSDAGNTDLDIGRGGEATGLVELSNSMLDMQAPLTGQGETFAWILIGTEGGTGTAVFDNSSADLRAAQGAGFRIGTRWTHTEDNTGDGTLILRDGAAVTVSSGGESADFWVGGGLGSTGRAEITSGSVLDLGGNGLLQAGHATPDMIGGGTGSVLISGAGSLVTGLRGVDLGRGGSDGSLTIADGARVMAGGLEAARNVNVDIGFDPDSRGTLTITNALFSAQMGPGAQEEFEFLGASVNFGRNGGTAQAVITGARMTDPDAQHGFIVLGHAKSDYTDITIAEDTGAQADVSVSGAFFGARNDGTSFGVDGPIDLPGNGGYAAVRIGLNGGIGHLDLSDRSTLYAISGGADQSAEIVVGSGSNAAATLTVMNETQVDIIARQFDAWLLAGTEGGATGTISIADSSVLIDAARNGGIRLGTSWFDTADQVGTGNLDVLEGSDITIRAAGNQALVHVGGGADSLAQMTLSDSALTLEGNAHRLVVVGGTPAFLPGTGGQGQLLLEGASTRLEGARDVTVGVNGATGTLELRAGATLALVDEGGGVEGRTLLGVGGGRVRANEANTFADGTLLVAGAETEITLDAADRAFVAIGTGGGTGRATLSQGARLALEADVTAVEIGVTGGAGHVDILGSGTELVVAGADGRIHVGRERNPDMTGDGPARGVLRIGEGAEVQVQTKVEIGDSTAHSALLAMEGGRLVTPLVEVYAGTGLQNNMLLGWGEITGTQGQPALLMSGSSFFVGDKVDATDTRVSGAGRMNITGNVVAQESAIYFDIADDRYDQIEVTGTFIMDGGSLNISLSTEVGLEFFSTGYQLLSASDGIVLNDVDINVMDLITFGSDVTTQLRNNGTELWAVLDGEGIPMPDVPLPPAWRDWLGWIGGGGGAPPEAPDFGGDSSTVMDPHLVTLDGLAYSFHAAGEFVLLRQIDGPLEVQARMAPVALNASENIAAAVQLDGGRVMIDAAEPNTIVVNGAELSLASGATAAIGTDLVYRTDDTWHLVHRHGDPAGSMISVISVKVVDDRLDISAFANDILRGQVEGLWGNFDGNPDTDLALRDGRLVARPLQFGDDPETGALGLYGAFRDEWRVTERDESLFFYAPDEGPDSFYLPDYPSAMMTLEDFAPEALAEAEVIVAASGLEPGTVAFDNALFDLLSTGNESYVAGALVVQAQRGARPETAPAINAPETVGGAMEGLVGLTGQVRLLPDRDLGDVQLTFTPEGRSVGHIRQSDAEGEFRFDLMEGTSGTLVAERGFNPSVDPRVTALDALNVLRLAVGVDPSWGPASPMNFIAADIDQSGRVTALDALEVLRSAVGLNNVHQPRWIFIDENADLSAIDRNNTQVDTSVTITDLGAEFSGVSMVGILLGNMQEVA